MRFVFLAGGIAGFVLAVLSGLIAGRAADRILLDAALGCLAGGLLFRWFWTVLVRGIRETILARHAAATAAAAAAPNGAAPNPAPKKS
jgi:hypothetical protein